MAKRLARVVAVLLAAMAVLPAGVAASSENKTSAAIDPIYVQTEVVIIAQQTVDVAPKAMRAKAADHGASTRELAAIAAASRCWQGYVGVQGKNLLGWVLYQYNEEYSWCGDGVWISWVNSYEYPSNLYFGVSYVGTSENSLYGVGWNVWQDHVSGHFTAAQTPVGPYIHYYPWIKFNVSGNGVTNYAYGSPG